MAGHGARTAVERLGSTEEQPRNGTGEARERPLTAAQERANRQANDPERPAPPREIRRPSNPLHIELAAPHAVEEALPLVPVVDQDAALRVPGRAHEHPLRFRAAACGPADERDLQAVIP